MSAASSRFFYGDPGRYARRLRQRLQVRGGEGVRDPDFALSRPADGDELLDKLRRDPVVAKALQQRLATVAACDWYLEAPNAASAKLVPYFEALLGKLERFTEARLLLGRAVFEGMRWAKMRGRVATLDLLGEGRPLKWWVCERLADVDKRRLRLDWEDAAKSVDDGGTMRSASPHSASRLNDDNANAQQQQQQRRYVWRLYDPTADRWHRVAHPEHFVRHRLQRDEASLGYGRGLLESLAVYWQAKTTLFAYMCEGAERFAYPWIIARIAPGSETAHNTDLGAGFVTAEQRAEALLDALEQMRKASVLVLDQEDDVETVDLSGEGNRLILDLVRYVDRCMVELILGSSLPYGGSSDGDAGSFARAKVEKETSADLLAFDREALEDTLTRDLVGALWRYNQPAFAALGLDHLEPPRLRLGVKSKRDPREAMEIIERAARIGLPLDAAEVYDALGLTRPSGGADVLFAHSRSPAGAAPQ